SLAAEDAFLGPRRSPRVAARPVSAGDAPGRQHPALLPLPRPVVVDLRGQGLGSARGVRDGLHRLRPHALLRAPRPTEGAPAAQAAGASHEPPLQHALPDYGLRLLEPALGLRLRDAQLIPELA